MEKIKKINLGGTSYDISTPNEQQILLDIENILKSYVKSINGQNGAVSVTKASLGLGNVSNVPQIPISEKGKANGVASLDDSGKVPAAQLPSYVDDVIEAASKNNFPAKGESSKIYIAEDTNKAYRWSGSEYREISQSLALGETTSTAFPGNRGKALETAVTALRGQNESLNEFTSDLERSIDLLLEENTKTFDKIVSVPSSSILQSSTSLTSSMVCYNSTTQNFIFENGGKYYASSPNVGEYNLSAGQKALTTKVFIKRPEGQLYTMTSAGLKKIGEDEYASKLALESLSKQIQSKMDTATANTLFGQKVDKGKASKVTMSVTSETLNITITQA